MGTVNVGVIGVGNCASSLVQGLEYYANHADGRAGLTNPVCAGYAISDVQVTSAFDVNASKIDRDLSEAIWSAPNNALKFADVPHLGIPVRGHAQAHERAGRADRASFPRGRLRLKGVGHVSKYQDPCEFCAAGDR